MSVKDSKSEVFSYFKKAKREYLARSLTISSKSFETHLGICVNANISTLEKHTRER